MGERKLHRPGKRERARAKKMRRGETWGSVPGVGTFTLKAGPKKWKEWHRSRRNPFNSHHAGNQS